MIYLFLVILHPKLGTYFADDCSKLVTLYMVCFCPNSDPQKQHADVVIQVLPTQLIPDDNEGKILRVRMIMKEGVPNFEPTYLFDEGSTISWVPCGRKLTCSYPGIKFSYGPDVYYDNEVWNNLEDHTFSWYVQHS